MTLKIRTGHFTGLSQLFNRDGDNLAKILRLMAADTVNVRVAAAVAADEFDLADLELTDNSTGEDYASIGDFDSVVNPHDATGSTGVQIAAFNTANVVVLNALTVLVKHLDPVREIAGLERIDADGTVATEGTIPAITKSVTSATGTAAVSFESARVALADVKAKLRKTVDYINLTLEAVGLDPLRSELQTFLYEGDLENAPAGVAAESGGVDAALKTEVDGFFSDVADVIATIAAHWNEQVSTYDPTKTLVSA